MQQKIVASCIYNADNSRNKQQLNFKVFILQSGRLQVRQACIQLDEYNSIVYLRIYSSPPTTHKTTEGKSSKQNNCDIIPENY